ncbi:MAG: Ig-like domain-containing protein [Bacteroidetes bacterium]|nr:Ig-like domain-containing protein [Bacteroidota bacterium]
MSFRFYSLVFALIGISFLTNAQQIQSVPARTQLLNAFAFASKAYNVPEDLLKAVAYAQTRYNNIIENNNDREPGAQPKVYGIMGLRNDDWFGHSLIEGANLIHQPADIVAVNASLNIQAAAALLSSIAEKLKIDRSNLNNWRPVLEEFSGIPQKNIRPFFTFDVFKVLSDGANLEGISISPKAEINMNQFSEEVNPKNKMKNVESVTDQSDYPPAVWDPSPNFYNDNNFNPLFLVVHDTEGGFAASLSWLKNPQSSASSHYIIRSSDGYIVQMVHEKYAAWHVSCWNRYMLGVEHEGYVSTPSYFTDAMYNASAGLFRHFIETWGVPLDSNHVIGHWQWEFPWWQTYIKQNYPYIDPTCNNHTDPGKYWDWNKYFNLIRSYATIPKAVSHFPANSTDSVWSNSQIKYTFSIAMDQAKTQNAITINPPAQGTFTWADYRHTLVFTPTTLLNPSIKYTITVAQTAQSILGMPIDSSYSFTFNTKPSVPLNVVTSYPANNQSGISTTVRVIVSFNTPVIKTSLGGKIFFQDSTGNSVSIKNAAYNEINGSGVLSFVPSSTLAENSVYKITIKAGIQSINGSQLINDFVSTFTTGKNYFVQGTVADNFESIGSWQNPSYSGSTVGVDTAQSKFDIVYGTQVDGQHSGRITYVYTNNTGGVCRVYDGAKPDVGTSVNNFGMWVFGDASNNSLEYWFYKNSNQNVAVRVDTLNWTGWKFVEMPLTNVLSTGDILFNSVVIVQNPAGADSGQVYVDGMQYRNSSAAGIQNPISDITPNQFKLEQNYPNPFNPSTVIQYQITKESFVTLKVYDMLGREVTALVNQYLQPGIYRVDFNTDNMSRQLTSGTYFYTLRAGNNEDTKKLILLK